MSLIGSSVFRPLKKPDGDTDPSGATGCGAKGRADILAILAGHTRHIYEATVGDYVTISGTDYTPCAPISPHGDSYPGHDHSGGRYGTPITRNLWSCVWGGDDTELSTGIQQGRAPSGTVTSAETQAVIINTDIRTLWIPNCAVDGVYRKAALRILVRASAACSATVEVRTHGLGDLTPSNFTLGVGDNTLTVGNVALRPGRLQNILFFVRANYTTATPATVTVKSAALLQTVSTP